MEVRVRIHPAIFLLVFLLGGRGASNRLLRVPCLIDHGGVGLREPLDFGGGDRKCGSHSLLT